MKRVGQLTLLLNLLFNHCVHGYDGIYIDNQTSQDKLVTVRTKSMTCPAPLKKVKVHPGISYKNANGCQIDDTITKAEWSDIDGSNKQAHTKETSIAKYSSGMGIKGGYLLIRIYDDPRKDEVARLSLKGVASLRLNDNPTLLP